jgi:hypothetical protein
MSRSERGRRSRSDSGADAVAAVPGERGADGFDEPIADPDPWSDDEGEPVETLGLRNVPPPHKLRVWPQHRCLHYFNRISRAK